VLSCLFAACKTTSPPTQTTTEPATPILVEMGNYQYSPEEFLESYTKNNQDSTTENLSPEEFLEVFTTNKLKLLAAEQQGRDTVADFKEEMASYKEQLALPYLTDKDKVEALTKEAYERLKEEIRVSHILISVDEEASAADTLSAYRAAIAMRGRLMEGSDFAEMAEKFSKDPTAVNNGGDLGYFTAFQMVYPFETATYATPIGQISQPIRSKSGYHLIKVHDRRANRGQLRVAHIMIQLGPKLTDEKKKEAEVRINEAYARLEKGEPWEKIVQVYSDDFQSRQQGGVLPIFGIGQMVPDFEATAFNLSTPGSYSKPVKTSYGWHVIRLLNKLPLETFAALETSLRLKVTTDSRGKLVEKAFIEGLKKQYTIGENVVIYNQLEAKADSTLQKGDWKLPSPLPAQWSQSPLFTIESIPTTTSDFIQHVREYASPRPAAADPKSILKTYYNDFRSKRLIEYEKQNLENKHPEYKTLLKEIKEDVLLSQVMEEQVWQRSLDDSLGQRKIYEQNLDKYRHPERAYATVIEAIDTTTLNLATQALAVSPYPLRLKGQELLFEENQTALSTSQLNSLFVLAATLKKNQTFVVEIAGHRTGNEPDSVSTARIGNVLRFLNGQGISITRIIEKNYGSFQPVPEPERNRRVSFVFYSQSKKDLEVAINAAKPGSIVINEGFYAQDHSIFKVAAWEIGSQMIKLPNGKSVVIKIERIEASRNKTFEEARGAVINEYQRILEKQWLESLKSKNPIKVNKEELEKLIR
jgi:peptidyl-prolyl cis-trans isomerase SurA